MTPLGTVKVCGIAIPVQIGDEDDNPNLAGAYGCYDLDDGIIWISHTCPAAEMPFWITHEACHALLQKSGALRVTALAFGLDVEKKAKHLKIASTWEEVFIRVMTPHIIETFGFAQGVS
jgi:hypothetical protein